MQRLLDLPFLVILMGLSALAMFLPATHALILGDHATARAFFYSAIILLVLTGMIAIATAQYQPRQPTHSHLKALVGAYALLPLLLALPMAQALPGVSYWDAWFEMISDFTTTGATLFAPEALPPSLHLWRALVGWLGGFFIIVMAMAVLAPMNLGGIEVVTGRTPGRSTGGTAQITRIAEPSQRITRHALQLFPAYGGATLVLWVGLLLAGDSSLVALSHAMATLSTSGISPVNGTLGTKSGMLGEMLIGLFLLASISRRVLACLVGLDRAANLKRDPELALAAVLVCMVTALLFLRHLTGASGADIAAAPASALHLLWGAMFTTLSFLTTTGFVSADWAGPQGWSGLGTPGLVLLGLATVGGGVATTAGGVRLLRVYALFRHGQRELERLVHPNSVGGAGKAARRMRREGAYFAWIFFMLFALSIGVVTALLTLFDMAFEPALIMAMAGLTTTGPLAAVAGDIAYSYSDLSAGPRAILAGAMVVGRLETLALLAFLAPDNWRG